jgi:hypothetical protein
VDEKFMKWLVGMKETPIGHGVIRDINSRFSELDRKAFNLRGQTVNYF